MSSAISTRPAESDADSGLRPWQFFLLAALACACAVAWMVRSQGVMVIVLLTVLMGTVAAAGLAAYRTVQPLISGDDDRTAMAGGRARAALDREKILTLRAIKELEFDRAMWKLSDDDFREMSGRLRTRAARLIQQLESGGGYRDRIEKDLARRLGEQTPSQDAHPRAAGASCATCATLNDADARFCKSCGARL